RKQIPPCESTTIRLRLTDQEPTVLRRSAPTMVLAGAHPFGKTFDEIISKRVEEAGEFYLGRTGRASNPDAAAVQRQAFAGLLWSKQFYHYDVGSWIEGDPPGPEPPAERRRGRNQEWRHLYNEDVISMPDKWEYPWYASWDLAFHCVTLAL